MAETQTETQATEEYVPELLCPLLTVAAGSPASCERESCAWWTRHPKDDRYSMCAIRRISLRSDSINWYLKTLAE